MIICFVFLYMVIYVVYYHCSIIFSRNTGGSENLNSLSWLGEGKESLH